MKYTEVQARLKASFVNERGIWSEEWEAILKLYPQYFERFLNLRGVSQNRARLSPKIQEFIGIAVAACTTHIYSPAIKAHIKAARILGASVEEIIEVIGLTYLVGIHTVTLGAPILQELMKEENVPYESVMSPEVFETELSRIKNEFIRQRGFWTDTWNPVLELDPWFFEAYVNFSSLGSSSTVLEPKDREIIICAYDAATTHLYGRGTKIHMRNALRLGATPVEIMEMLEITSLMGIHGVAESASFLVKEMEQPLAVSTQGDDGLPKGSLIDGKT